MKIIKNRAIIRDEWRLDAGGGAGDDGDAGGHAYCILPLVKWAELRECIAGGGPVGVLLAGDDEVEALADALQRLALVALRFDNFADGRGYSQAVQLRRQYDYRGEVRALDVHRDNLALLERCGVDSYSLAEGEDWEGALEGFGEITVL